MSVGQKVEVEKTESDRVAYRVACRAANAEITWSREVHNNQRLQSVAGDQRSQWYVGIPDKKTTKLVSRLINDKATNYVVCIILFQSG